MEGKQGVKGTTNVKKEKKDTKRLKTAGRKYRGEERMLETTKEKSAPRLGPFQKGLRAVQRQRSPDLSRKRTDKFALTLQGRPEACGRRGPTHCSRWENEASGRTPCFVKKIRTFTNAPSKASGSSRPLPLAGGPSPGQGRELTRRFQVPVAGTPAGAAAALKGPAVKVLGGLWGRAEWAPGGKQTLNFQLGLDLPGGVWAVCKGAAEAFRAFGWVPKGSWGWGSARGSPRVGQEAPSRTQRNLWGWGKGWLPPPRRLGSQEVWVVLRPQPRALIELQDLEALSLSCSFGESRAYSGLKEASEK